MSMHERMLWDYEWVQGGCVGQPPPDTNADDAIGTYLTNYAIAIVGILAALAVSDKKLGATVSYQLFSSSFFGWTAVGFGLAGVLHQVVHSEDYPEVWWTISYACVLLGNAALCALSIEMLVSMFPRLAPAECCLKVTALVINCAVIVEPVVMVLNLVLGLLLAMLVWLVRACAQLPGLPLVKALGAFLMAAGYAIQGLLAPTCGGAGYADCWRNCPLPTAPYFNHNALFHAVYCVGLLLVGGAMYYSPDLSMEQRGYEAERREPTEMEKFFEEPLPLYEPGTNEGCNGCAKNQCAIM